MHATKTGSFKLFSSHSGQDGDAKLIQSGRREESHGFDIITAAAKGSQGHAVTTTRDINQQYKNKITTGI